MIEHRFLTKRHANHLSKVAKQMFEEVDCYFPGTDVQEVVCTQKVTRSYEKVVVFESSYNKVVGIDVSSHAAVTVFVSVEQTDEYPPGTTQMSEERTERLNSLVRKLFDVIQRRFFIIPTKLAIYRTDGRIVVLIREPEELMLSSNVI